MRYAKPILAALFLATLPAGAAAPGAGPGKNAIRQETASLHLAPVALVFDAPERAHVRACANLAALRALRSQQSGSDYATQNRILELTFMLCMSGAPADG